MDKAALLETAKNIKIAEERGIDFYISAKLAVIKVSRDGFDVVISIKNDDDVDFKEVMRYSANIFGYLNTAEIIKLIQEKSRKDLI